MLAAPFGRRSRLGVMVTYNGFAGGLVIAVLPPSMRAAICLWSLLVLVGWGTRDSIVVSH